MHITSVHKSSLLKMAENFKKIILFVVAVSSYCLSSSSLVLPAKASVKVKNLETRSDLIWKD